jgi:hypothetical protein
MGSIKTENLGTYPGEQHTLERLEELRIEFPRKKGRCGSAFAGNGSRKIRSWAATCF